MARVCDRSLSEGAARLSVSLAWTMSHSVWLGSRRMLKTLSLKDNIGQLDRLELSVLAPHFELHSGGADALPQRRRDLFDLVALDLSQTHSAIWLGG